MHLNQLKAELRQLGVQRIDSMSATVIGRSMRVAWHACYEWGTSRHAWWGTAMLGTVEFDILVVRKKLDDIFTFRRSTLTSLFGEIRR